MLNKFAFKVVLAGLLASLSGSPSAQEGQWYLGIGRGISQLQPDAADATIKVDNQRAQVATVFIGRDLATRSSGQFQLYALGEGEYSDGQSNARYAAADASLLYRFHDSRDRQLRESLPGISLYGRLGIGIMQRDSDLPLDTDAPVYFGAGAGIEAYLSFNLAMRLEALYHGTDAASASLTLISRFGGHPRLPTTLPAVPVKPATATASPATDTASTEETAVNDIDVQESAVAVPTDLPEVYEVPPTITQTETAIIPESDSDADGVMDARDLCPDSTPGYPVTARGCPVFAGTLPGLTFTDPTAALTSDSYDVLDKLVQELKDYSSTYIELVAHTDNTGTESVQSEVTRQRLRSIGVYLVRHGIDHERLLLRSYGGSRPAFDNSTVDGRRRNNRIEVFENP